MWDLIDLNRSKDARTQGKRGSDVEFETRHFRMPKHWTFDSVIAIAEWNSCDSDNYDEAWSAQCRKISPLLFLMLPFKLLDIRAPCTARFEISLLSISITCTWASRLFCYMEISTLFFLKSARERFVIGLIPEFLHSLIPKLTFGLLGLPCLKVFTTVFTGAWSPMPRSISICSVLRRIHHTTKMFFLSPIFDSAPTLCSP